MGDIAFTFLYADSEDEAVALFEPTMVGLVILDDDLKQGTCRSVLTRLRSIDPYVPTIAMTGEDNREVALDLLRMGIDAHIGKHELDGQILAQRVRETMGRADARRVPPTCPPVEVAPATGFSSWLGSLGAMLVS
jgi:DNA-binding response OmpR family regulator